MEIIGTLHRIDKIENYGYSYQHRFFYIKYTDEKEKEQFLKFKLSNGRTELIDSFKIGDKIKIIFNLEGIETKKDKNEPAIIYDRKEVYGIKGLNETKVEDVEKEIKFYELQEGEEDEPLKIN